MWSWHVKAPPPPSLFTARVPISVKCPSTVAEAPHPKNEERSVCDLLVLECLNLFTMQWFHLWTQKLVEHLQFGLFFIYHLHL